MAPRVAETIACSSWQGLLKTHWKLNERDPAQVDCMDHGIRRILAALERNGRGDDTLSAESLAA